MRLLSKKEVRAKTTYSPAHIDRLEKQGLFPTRVKLGQTRVAWVESEVELWIEARIADRDLSAGS